MLEAGRLPDDADEGEGAVALGMQEVRGAGVEGRVLFLSSKLAGACLSEPLLTPSDCEPNVDLGLDP